MDRQLLSPAPASRLRVRVEGVVQGVGFRPFVHGLASAHGLSGLVGNDTAGVFLEVEGDREELDRFLAALETDAPPLAVIDRVEVEVISPIGSSGFTIVVSDSAGERQTLISPDTATCDDCLAELFDPRDRRFRHPFINCTNCGPRFTIIRDVPYDRPLTTMSGFAMCADCRREYEDPGDRRFHAQPVCCLACGPSLRRSLGSRSPLPSSCSPRAACSPSRGWAAITWPPSPTRSRPSPPCARASIARTSRLR
jgi:hydrogenase maturation protein HypF